MRADLIDATARLPEIVTAVVHAAAADVLEDGVAAATVPLTWRNVVRLLEQLPQELRDAAATTNAGGNAAASSGKSRRIALTDRQQCALLGAAHYLAVSRGRHVGTLGPLTVWALTHLPELSLTRIPGVAASERLAYGLAVHALHATAVLAADAPLGVALGTAVFALAKTVLGHVVAAMQQAPSAHSPASAPASPAPAALEDSRVRLFEVHLPILRGVLAAVQHASFKWTAPNLHAFTQLVTHATSSLEVWSHLDPVYRALADSSRADEGLSQLLGVNSAEGFHANAAPFLHLAILRTCTRAYAQTAFTDAAHKVPAQNPVVAAQAVPSPTDDSLPQSHNDRSQDLVEALQQLVGAGKLPAPESAFADPAVWTAFNGAATAFACAHVKAIGDSPHDQPKISLLAEAMWVLTLAAMADETPVATILPLLTRVLATARLTSQEPLVQTALPCLGLLAMRYPDHGDAVMTALRTFVTDPAPILAVLATSDASSAHRLAQAAGVTYARLLRTQSSAPTDKASESQRRKSISSLVVSKFAWPPSKSTEPGAAMLAGSSLFAMLAACASEFSESSLVRGGVQ